MQYCILNRNNQEAQRFLWLSKTLEFCNNIPSLEKLVSWTDSLLLWERALLSSVVSHCFVFEGELARPAICISYLTVTWLCDFSSFETSIFSSVKWAVRLRFFPALKVVSPFLFCCRGFLIHKGLVQTWMAHFSLWHSCSCRLNYWLQFFIPISRGIIHSHPCQCLRMGKVYFSAFWLY